ncbi:MAG: leucine-rich repeat domain-containing protein [Clostridiales bacterium]|nr:leucine-rich repeat domain-containing protein [Clostridiales bacterium]
MSVKNLFAALAVLIFLFAFHASAEDAWDCDYTPRTPAEISGDWEYIVLPDGTAEITYYNDRQVDVLEIPSQLDGYTVTGIGKDAISCYYELTSVTIPDSVTVIGDWAFWSCYSLISVNIPDSVTDIGERAFSECESLESVTIPNSVTVINQSAFLGCDSLESISIPESVTDIGDSAFRYCEGLTSVTIPGSVTSIGEKAFANCENLTSITIPGSVMSIGEKAFDMYFDRSDQLVFTVEAGSYAEEYCKDNGFTYQYPGADR